MPTRTHTTRIHVSRARGRLALAALCALLFTFAVAPAARAASRIYWSNFNGNSISWANLDGSGGGDLPINPATINGPMGMAIDTLHGKIYWANFDSSSPGAGTSLGVANLDGSDAHIVPIAAGLVAGPHGVGVDAAAGKLYWTNRENIPSPPSWIGVANLDGSGASKLDVGGNTTIDNPRGLALDLNAGKIYWANWSENKLSWASLKGGTGGDLNSGGATVEFPEGVALDRAGRLFFGNFHDPPGPGETISYINLDGSGGADLRTAGATQGDPHGLAIDPSAHRVYWPNFDDNSISWANLDGSGGADLPTAGATKQGPDLPVILKTPVSTGDPKVKGSARPGAHLRCGNGSWAADELESLLYQAPTSYSFSWSRHGKAISGADSSSFHAKKLGEYRCTVNAANAAGASTESALVGTFKIGRVALNRAKGTATLTVRVPGPGKLSVKGKGLGKSRSLRADRAATDLGRKVKKRGKTKLVVKPKGKLKKRLARHGTAKVKAKIVFTPRGGDPSTQTKKLKLKEAG